MPISSSETDKMFVDTVNQILSVEDKNTQILMDNCREAVKERQSAIPHITSCEICQTFEIYKGHNDMLYGMTLYPRPTIEGIDDYWKEHKEHLIEFGKYHHIPYSPLISKELISVLPSTTS